MQEVKRILSCMCVAALVIPRTLGVGEAAIAADDGTTTRLVCAHYMVCFFHSVDFYKQEIELAQRHGINGFALNCGDWGTLDSKTGELKPGNYVQAAERMFEAARQLDSGFQLFFSADLNNLRDLPSNIGDMVKRFYQHPNQFRHRGKAVLSGWAGHPSAYAESIRKLQTENFQVCFVPFVSNSRYPMCWSMETALRFFQDQPHMDGVFFFGADGCVWDILRTNANGRRATLFGNKLFMAGLAPVYNSANLRDFHGMEGYAAVWQGILRDEPDWVEIVTWNDYTEDSNLMPYRWRDGQEKQYYDRDEAFLDVTGYYSAWYRSGVQPRIAQDKLYFVYRNRPRWLRQAWDDKEKKWVDLSAGPWPIDQIHDDVEDKVYATTFLTAPAELTIQIGKSEETFEMPAGVSHAAMPMTAGVPRFLLRRKGEGREAKALIDVIGRQQIISKATETNSVRGYHLANRTWAGAAAVGEILRIEAESGQIHGGARVIRQGGVTAVLNAEEDGSGFTVPVQGLQTATYNVRIRFSNPSENDVRLTLMADGPPRGPKEYPYYIPAFLPPTGKGRFATVSFFWSLYDKTTFLKLQWMRGDLWGKPNPDFNDKGAASIDAIELARVAPTLVPGRPDSPLPEMVEIPAGPFVMGSKDGEPDEAPPRRVTLSSFAMSRHEITNEQYEQFDPSHRILRDEYSWRGREPVIYVSWTDAVRYCNWLSGKAGLPPVYDEKTWTADLKAGGFRLPTEAEWEYVASGRGEGRRYPWGKAPPDNTRCRRMEGLEISAGQANPGSEGAGTVIVGSFPAGQSRDGVLDLGGNVAEWCSDWYHPYSPEDQTDPFNQTPGNYRVIRGGSWGYYGKSQRTADREFNNPHYPGYIYIGFRVVSRN